MLLGLWGPLKSMENGKLMDFLLLPLLLSVFLSYEWFCCNYFLMFLEVHWCFFCFVFLLEVEECSGWGRFELGYLKCKRSMFLFMAVFCEQLLQQTQILMPSEYDAFSKQAQASYSITLLCILIPAIRWDQLWLESEAFISEPPPMFIKTSYAWACSIWSF